MKRLFKVDQNSSNADIALLILRIVIGVLMLVHGFPKMLTLFSGEPVQFPALLGTPEFSLGMAVFAEVVCSLLIIFGIATRLATIPLIVTMLVAVLLVHGADPFTKQEMGLHYLLSYIVLLITGSGKYSIDQLLTKSRPVLAYAK
ncbi:MAG TPA: DoxX family protein [Daejeonella sp.]|nr:DoxX family protein [Daejeonella sp.]